MAENQLTQPTAQAQIASFKAALSGLHGHPERIGAFALTWRTGMHDALSLLPPRYAEVLHGLLDRLESSALFAEESCSFSHTDLLDGLQTWASKAARQLESSTT